MTNHDVQNRDLGGRQAIPVKFFEQIGSSYSPWNFIAATSWRLFLYCLYSSPVRVQGRMVLECVLNSMHE